MLRFVRWVPLGVLIGVVTGQYLGPPSSSAAVSSRNLRELFFNPSEDPKAGTSLVALPSYIRKQETSFVLAFTMGNCSSCSQVVFDSEDIATVEKIPKIAIVEEVETDQPSRNPWPGFDLTIWLTPKEYRKWNASWSGRAYVLSCTGKLIHAQTPNEQVFAMCGLR